MALWQYNFLVIPRYSFKNIPSNTKLILGEDGFVDDSFFWIPQMVNVVFFEDINNILPKTISWSKNITLYGGQESNCFEILLENDIVKSVSFRISFISDYERVLTELIEFCILKGLLILDEELNILPLNVEAVKETIEHSSQLKKYLK